MLKIWLIFVATVLMTFPTCAASKPTKPKIQTRHVLTSRDAVLVSVRIQPDPAIRSVILEAWEAESVSNEDDASMPMATVPKELIRSSSEPVNEGNADQSLFAFRWPALPPGTYVLIARVFVGRGISYASAPFRIEVS